MRSHRESSSRPLEINGEWAYMPVHRGGIKMRSVTLRGRSWRKSSHSAACGDCVEVGRLINGRIGVRDTKNVSQQALGFTTAQWRTFIGEVKLTDRNR